MFYVPACGINSVAICGVGRSKPSVLVGVGLERASQARIDPLYEVQDLFGGRIAVLIKPDGGLDDTSELLPG